MIDAYAPILDEYLKTHSETTLYQASLLSQRCIDAGLGPEDIIALHCEALDHVLAGYPPRHRLRASDDASQFLLEIMIGYGVRYREYVELKLTESLRDAEARTELERRRALDAERAQRDKGELLTMVAHELRTPLTAVKGSIDLAQRYAEQGKSERVPRLLGTAQEAISRLSRLTADLVEAGRTGLIAFERSPVNLAEVVTQACSWARPSAALKDIALDQAPPTEPQMIWGNTDALLSLFGNLLSNAVRYTPPGGRIDLRYHVTADTVRIDVADSGIGIAPESLERIFEKFSREPEAARIEAHGLGLGLALVRQMVKAHEGTIEVKSIPTAGTTFSVTLPRLPPAVRSMAEAEPRARGRSASPR
jgi:signal transduction histidine kinase